jgi:four helix bundle protein
VLEAARGVADTIQRLLGPNGGVLSARELDRAARSMAANIAEGSRTSGDVRDRCFCNARSFAVETRELWRLAFATEQLQPWVFWPIQHRLVTIVRILDASIEE